jgi:regulator of protease activity HflC (stomatin/prohibitin superfamily)
MTILKGNYQDGESGIATLIPGGKILRWAGLVIAVFVGWLILSNIMSVTRIDAGHVGIEINLAGSQRGPSDIPIRTGWVFYSPLRSQIIQFPTYVQTVKWTRNPNEGHPVNEEMGFNSKEGMEILADVSLSYAIDGNKVRDFFVKYRISDLDLFTHGILRDIVRNSLNEVASTYTVEDIYGERKAEFLKQVETMIESKVAPVGVSVQQFGFIGAPRVPAVIANSIVPATSWQPRRPKPQRRSLQPRAMPSRRSCARRARPTRIAFAKAR